MTTTFQLMDIGSLKPNPNNPRLITESDVDKMCVYLRAHGFLDPIEARIEDHLILAGHRRYLAALKLGLARVPVLFHAGLSDQEAWAYSIAHNRSQEDVEWNRALLADQLSGMEENLVPGLGFSEKELALLFDLDRGADGDDEDEAADARDPEGSRLLPGDTWIIGPCTFVVWENLSQLQMDAAEQAIRRIAKLLKSRALLNGEEDRELDQVLEDRKHELAQTHGA